MFLFWALGSIPLTAYADDTGPVALVQCEAPHDRMLLQFGDTDPESNQPSRIIGSTKLAPIPKSMAQSWQHVSRQLAGTCRFHDGQMLKVRPSYGPAFAGVDPPGYFILAIQGHLIYANFPYEGGGFDRAEPGHAFPVSAIEYDGHQLLQCSAGFYTSKIYHYSGESGPAHPACKDVSNRLLPGHKFMTPSEQSAVTAIDYKRRLLTSLSPLCRKIWPHVRGYGKTAQPAPKFRPIQFDDQASFPDFMVSRASIDIDNHGHKISVWSIYGYTHAFAGQYLLAFPQGTAETKAALINFLKGPHG